MSILINMEMPKNCEECKFSWWDVHHLYCEADGKPWGLKVTEYADGRHPDCPLTEIPQHGRLIDADVLLASFKESIDECHNWANEIPNETEMYARVSQALGTFVECGLRTKGMPTVIPADKDGET